MITFTCEEQGPDYVRVFTVRFIPVQLVPKIAQPPPNATHRVNVSGISIGWLMPPQQPTKQSADAFVAIAKTWECFKP